MENEEIILIKREHSRNARTCHSSDLTRQRFFTPCNESLIDSNGQFLGRSSFQHKTPNSFQENRTFSRKVFRLLTFSTCASHLQQTIDIEERIILSWCLFSFFNCNYSFNWIINNLLWSPGWWSGYVTSTSQSMPPTSEAVEFMELFLCLKQGSFLSLWRHWLEIIPLFMMICLMQLLNNNNYMYILSEQFLMEKLGTRLWLNSTS